MLLFTNGDATLPLAVGPREASLALAYSRIAEGEAGGVARAFVRLLSKPPPRRRASVR